MVIIQQSGNTRVIKRSGSAPEVKGLFNSRGYFSDWGVTQLRRFGISENDAWNLMCKPIKDLSRVESAMIATSLKIDLADVK